MTGDLILKIYFFLCCTVVFAGCVWIFVGLLRFLRDLERSRDDLLLDQRWNHNHCQGKYSDDHC
jgi:hypothetical protein